MAWWVIRNGAVYEGANWGGELYRHSDTNVEQALADAHADANVGFFFYCTSGFSLSGHGSFSANEAVFFSGSQPWVGSAPADLYIKMASPEITVAGQAAAPALIRLNPENESLTLKNDLPVTVSIDFPGGSPFTVNPITVPANGGAVTPSWQAPSQGWQTGQAYTFTVTGESEKRDPVRVRGGTIDIDVQRGTGR